MVTKLIFTNINCLITLALLIKRTEKWLPFGLSGITWREINMILSFVYDLIIFNISRPYVSILSNQKGNYFLTRV